MQESVNSQEDFISMSVKDLTDNLLQDKYGLLNMSYCCVLNFFSLEQVSQSQKYFLEDEDALARVIGLTGLRFLAQFGIYNRQMTQIDLNKDYLLILDSEDLESTDRLQAVVEEKKQECQCSYFKFGVIRAQFKDSNKIDKANEILRSVLPEIIVLNNGFKKFKALEPYQTRQEGKRYLNAAKYFLDGYVVQNLAYFEIVNSVYDICDQIEADFKSGGYDYVYFDDVDGKYKDNSAKDSAPWVFSTIAAYLMAFKEVKFEFPQSGDGIRGKLLQSITIQNIAKFREAKYNYQDKYLKMISTPLSVGFRLHDGDLYSCILDRAKTAELGEITVSLIEANFDIERKNVISSSHSSNIVRIRRQLNTIKFVSIREFWNLGTTDFHEFKKSVDGLSEVFRDFGLLVQKHLNLDVMQNFDFSTMLLYQVDGEYKLGFISDIYAAAMYVTAPIDPRFSFFRRKFELEEFSKILDYRIFEKTGEEYLDRVTQQVANTPLARFTDDKFQETDWAKGIITSALPQKAQIWLAPQAAYSTGQVKHAVPGENCKATPEQIFIWSDMCLSLRGSKAIHILQLLKSQSAMQRGLLTPYGGPLTLNISTTEIKQEDWR